MTSINVYLYEKYLKLFPNIKCWLPSTNGHIFLTTALELFKQDQVSLTHCFSRASSTDFLYFTPLFLSIDVNPNVHLPNCTSRHLTIITCVGFIHNSAVWASKTIPMFNVLPLIR